MLSSKRIVEMVQFFQRVNVGCVDDCWIWTMAKNKQGYGVAYFRKEVRLAHRVSFKLVVGEIPDGLFVLHRCDNPPCCNPAHLWLGTHDDNMADAASKGRSVQGDRHWSRMFPERVPRGELAGPALHPERISRGERHYQAKINDEIVEEIKQLYIGGEYQRDIAKRVGINQSQVSRIVNDKAWQPVRNKR